MKFSTSIFIAALLLPIGGVASDVHGKFRNFIPAGFDSCRAFVTAVDNCQQGRCTKISLFKVWSAGYLTSYNLLTPDTYDIAGGREADSTDRSTIIWLEDYCRHHPSQTYTEAIKRLTIELYPHRIKIAPAE